MRRLIPDWLVLTSAVLFLTSILFQLVGVTASQVLSPPIIGFSINPAYPHYATIRENGLLEVTDYQSSAIIGAYFIPLPFQDINNLDPTGFNVRDISYSSDGSFIAVSITGMSSGGMIYSVEWDTGLIREALGEVNLSRIVDMSSSPDGERLVVASIDGGADQLLISDVAIVNISTGEIEQNLARMSRVDGQAWAVVAWSSLDRIAYANNTTLVFWDASANSTVLPTATSAEVRDAVWSPDGYRLATLNADRTLQIWDVNSDLSAPVTVMSLTVERFLSRDMQWLDNNLLAVNLWTDIQIWDTSTGVLKEVIETDHFIFGLGVLDNNELAFAGPESVSTFSLADLQNPITCDATIPAADVPALISAITAANSAATSQMICLEEGTYTLTGHDNITNGRNGFPVISKGVNRGRPITIVGLGNGATITRSPGIPQMNYRFFYVAPDGTLTLDNITLSNGYAPGNEIAGAGGAILNEGELRIKNSILIGNRANTQAGAIYSPGITQLEDTAILDSVANTDGGAIFTALTGRVEILRGEIRNNSANTSSGRGGAIYINGGYVRVVDALIQGNSAYTGGGIYITKSASAYSTLLQIAGGSRILENFAGAGSGGGLYSTSSGVTLISDALFSGNRTSGVGAGIWSAGALTIRDSAFESNGDTNFGTAGAIYSFGTLSLSDARIGNNLVRSTVSGRGGGVYIAGGMASIHQTEFIGNRAGNGAGLYTINSDTTITNSTFQGNIASHNGGAINNNARITVRDSLFTQNDDAAGGEDVYSASATVHRLVATSCFVNTNPAESGVFSTTMNFDARNNWWGSSSGPFAGSPPGTGQVNGNIVYSPFVTEGCAPTTGAGVPESDQWLRLEHVCVQSDGSADVWRVTNLNSVPIVFWYRWTDSNDLGGTLEAPGNGSVEIEIERALPGSITGVGASVRIVVDDVVQAQAIVSNVPGWVQPPVCPE